MSSENAKLVARKVSETIRKGKRVNLGNIIKESGYSEITSKSPTLVTKTKTYQKEIRPLAQGIDREIERIKKELATRVLSDERYETLTRAMDILIKNHQLLTGGETERVGISGVEINVRK